MSLINDALKRASQTQKQTPADRGVMSGSPLQPVIGGRQRKKSFNPLLIVIPVVLLAGGGAAGWFFLSKRDKPPASASPTAPTQTQTVAAPNEAADPKTSQPIAKTAQEPKSTTATTPKQTEATKAVPPKVDLAATKKTESSGPSAVTKTVAPSGGSTPPASSSARSASTPPSTVTSKEAPTSAPKTEVAVAKEASKPAATKPTTAAVGKAFPPIKVQGIFYRVKDPSVLLNGKTLFLGEELDGVTVKKIERTSVTLEYSGQEKVFSLR